MGFIGALGVSAWVVLGVLLGFASGALFHLLFSRDVRQLPLYLGIGAIAALGGGLLGAQVGPTPWSVGEAHLLAIFGAAWSALALARLLGL
jgi:hypothetical protein